MLACLHSVCVHHLIYFHILYTNLKVRLGKNACASVLTIGLHALFTMLPNTILILDRLGYVKTHVLACLQSVCVHHLLYFHTLYTHLKQVRLGKDACASVLTIGLRASFTILSHTAYNLFTCFIYYTSTLYRLIFDRLGQVKTHVLACLQSVCVYHLLYFHTL